MEFTKSLLREKLRVELHLLKQTPLGSLCNVLQSVNQLVWAEESLLPAFQKIQHHITELSIVCNELSESERLQRLNDYFFRNLDFKLNTNSDDIDSWLISSVFENRKGHPLIVSLLYLIFAERLQIPVSLLNHKSFCLLKWSRPKESSIVDLSLNGSGLTTKQIIERFRENSCFTDELETLTYAQAAKEYLNQLLIVFSTEEHSIKKLSLLDALLNIDPSNLNYLGQRALLYKDLNQRKPALEDLKRYFSYVEQAAAPDNIQNAYYELCLEPTPHNLIH